MDPRPVFDRLRADHARVLSDLVGLERAAAGLGDGAEDEARLQVLRDLVRMLERQFATHMAAEDEVLFPALAGALPETSGRIEALRAEHGELRDMLDTLAGLLAPASGPPPGEQIAVQAQDLVDLLRIHIRKEEAVVFRVAERVLEPRQIGELAARMGRGAGGPSVAPPGA